MPNQRARYVDAHCHVNFNAYGDETEAVVARARAAGVAMVAVGSRFETSVSACGCADLHDNVWAVVGMHPTHCFDSFEDPAEEGSGRHEKFDPARYLALARTHKKVIAIGECGIDYYHLPAKVELPQVRERQMDVLRQHADIALESGRPLMIHTRDGKGGESAHTDVLAVLREYAAAGKPLRGDIHCFSGRWAEAEQYLDFGFYLSFTGNLTYPPRSAEKKAGETLADVVRRMPFDRIIAETDAPYLAPVPHRGERNEPAYVLEVVKKIAEIRGVSEAEAQSQILENTERMYGVEFVW